MKLIGRNRRAYGNGGIPKAPALVQCIKGVSIRFFLGISTTSGVIRKAWMDSWRRCALDMVFHVAFEHTHRTKILDICYSQSMIHYSQNL